MSKFETYRAITPARPDQPEGAVAAAVERPFKIDVRFMGGLTSTQMDAFAAAADRWVRMITGDLPDVHVDGEIVDDVLIEAQGIDIDGLNGILGQAGPTRVRPNTAPFGALLPAKGQMSFDRADLASMEAKGTLRDVITHEMGHVLGIGTLWKLKNLVDGSGGLDPVFNGSRAKQAWGEVIGAGPTSVPVENTGGPGTREGHWRETIFLNELMSGFISIPGNPISKVTVASLIDLGYVADMSAAEPWTFPNLIAMAREGALVAEPLVDLGNILTSIPLELPPDSLR